MMMHLVSLNRNQFLLVNNWDIIVSFCIRNDLKANKENYIHITIIIIIIIMSHEIKESLPSPTNAQELASEISDGVTCILSMIACLFVCGRFIY